jgi:molybdate transport system substrate-binding protein
MLNKFFTTILFCLVFATAAAQAIAQELLVFAGAGMRRPLMEIGDQFERKTGIRVVNDFAGSGRLGNKILLGQKPAVFIPGGAKWAKILVTKGYIRNYTPIAYHTPVIITPKGNRNITSLQGFCNTDNRVVLGDPKAAAIGGISERIFQKSSIRPSMINVKARGGTVKQLVLWVEGNNADAAIVWRADAVQSGKVRVVELADGDIVVDIIPLCLMEEDNEAATQYAHYVLSAEGKKVFEAHGFKATD